MTFEVNAESFRASGRTVLELGWQGWEKGNEQRASDKNAEKVDFDESNDGEGQNDQGSQILGTVQ